MARISEALEILRKPRSPEQSGPTETLSEKAYEVLMGFDEARFATKNGPDDAGKSGKRVLALLEGFPKEDRHQMKAFHRQLASQDLTHFARTTVFEEPALVVDMEEDIGAGQNVVGRVKVGSQVYARKKIPMRDWNRDKVTEDIRKEIRVIQVLEHPHVIRVFLTYKEKLFFYILVHPFADLRPCRILRLNGLQLGRRQAAHVEVDGLPWEHSRLRSCTKHPAQRYQAFERTHQR